MRNRNILIGSLVLSILLITSACITAVTETPVAPTVEPATPTTEVVATETIAEPPTTEPTVAPTDVPPTATSDVSGPALDGKVLLETNCTVCHSLGRVQSAHKDLSGWTATVNRMVGKGANLTPEQASAVALYLSLTYP